MRFILIILSAIFLVGCNAFQGKRSVEPVVVFSIKSKAYRGEIHANLHQDGRLIHDVFRERTESWLTRLEVAELLYDLDFYGFFTLDENELRRDIHRAVETESSLGPLVMVDGAIVTLTVRAPGKTNSITWPNPLNYAEHYSNVESVQSLGKSVYAVSKRLNVYR